MRSFCALPERHTAVNSAAHTSTLFAHQRRDDAQGVKISAQGAHLKSAA